MKQEQHRDMVFTLAKKPQDILESFTPEKVHHLHMIDGIGDEYHEFNEELEKFNVISNQPSNKRCIKELGDLLFYTEGLLMHLDELKSAVTDDGKTLDVFLQEGRPLISFSETMKNLFEFSKRWVFYNKEPNIKQLAHVYNSLIGYITDLAKFVGSSLEEVRQANYDKLSDRYEDLKYSDDAAILRKDTQTRPDPLGADALNEN